MSELSEWANVEEGDTQNTTSQEIIMARLCANYLVSDVLGICKGKNLIHKILKLTLKILPNLLI